MNLRTIDKYDVVVVVLIVVAFLLVANLPFGAKQFGDFDIHTDAKRLAAAIHGDLPLHDVELNRLPFTTLYYAVPYVFVPSGASDQTYWKAAMAWTIPWIAFSLLLIRRVAERVFGGFAGLISVGLILSSPFVIYYALGITAEGPAWLTITVFLFGWSQWGQRATAGAMLLGTFGLLGIVLCRPNAILILAVGFLCGTLLWRRQRSQAIFAISCTGLALALSMVIAIAESYLPHPVPVRSASENFAYVALHGSFQFRDEPWDWRFWDDETRRGSVDYAHWVAERKALKELSEHTGQPLAQLELHWVAEDYLHHPLLRLRMALIRLLSIHVSLANSVQPRMFHLGPLRGSAGWIFFQCVANASTALMVVAALWFLIQRRGQALSLWPLWAPWLALALFHIFIYAEPRYLMPARPGLAVLAGCSLAALLVYVGRRPADAVINRDLDKGSVVTAAVRCG